MPETKITVSGVSVPVLGANHPSSIWYTKNDGREKAFEVMQQDLISVCWQTKMGSDNSPAILRQWQGFWEDESNTTTVCIHMEIQAYGRSKPEVINKCKEEYSSQTQKTEYKQQTALIAIYLLYICYYLMQSCCLETWFTMDNNYTWAFLISTAFAFSWLYFTHTNIQHEGIRPCDAKRKKMWSSGQLFRGLLALVAPLLQLFIASLLLGKTAQPPSPHLGKI